MAFAAFHAMEGPPPNLPPPDFWSVDRAPLEDLLQRSQELIDRSNEVMRQLDLVRERVRACTRRKAHT